MGITTLDNPKMSFKSMCLGNLLSVHILLIIKSCFFILPNLQFCCCSIRYLEEIYSLEPKPVSVDLRVYIMGLNLLMEEILHQVVQDFFHQQYQLMANWWFGLVVWDSRGTIPFHKEMSGIQTTGPQTINLPLVDNRDHQKKTNKVLNIALFVGVLLVDPPNANFLLTFHRE